MIDVHAHMSNSCFDADLEEVLERAVSGGVKYVLTAGEDYEDNLKILDLASRYSVLKPCLGHYPAVLDKEMAEKSARLIRENADSLTGIGEVGLDYWKVQDEIDRRLMEDIFGLFIDLSRETSLPLIVHSRSSGKYAIEMLLSKGAENVCMHAFDGKAGAAQKAIAGGYFFSIPPSLSRSAQKQKLVSRLPLENILLETDSPVLGPDAESRNEPANLIHAAKKIAEIKNLTVSAVQKATLENTCRLFPGLTAGLPKSTD